MKDSLPTKEIATTPESNLPKTPNGDEQWPVTRESTLVITLENPGTPNSLEFTLTPTDEGEIPEGFEGVEFTVTVQDTPTSPEESYSPFGEDSPKVGENVLKNKRKIVRQSS